MPRGKFIVIDGSDGSGKTTQTQILIKRLQKAGHKVKIEDFPQYGKKSAGLIEEYLSGAYGRELGAYIPSVFFAVDRFAAADRIRKNLKAGYVVVSNRYVTANMAHQGGKITNKAEREKYFKWLNELEYNFFKIPKPDLHIILHLPAAVSNRLIKKRGLHKDIHEKDLQHLRSAEKIYLEIARKFKYYLVSGFVKGRLLSKEAISDIIYPIVHGYLRNRN